MLLAAWLLLSGWAAANIFLRRFAPGLTSLESLALSLPVSFLLEAWAAFLISLALGSLQPLSLILASLLFTLIIFPHIFSEGGNAFRESLAEAPAQLRLQPLLVVLLLLGLMGFGYLFSTHYLDARPDGLYSGGSAWADGAAHLTYANSFLHGVNSHLRFPPRLPILANTPLTYPFLPDFHAAALAAGGMGMREAMAVPGLFLALTFIALLYLFSLRFSGSKKVSAFAVVLVLFSGGLGFLSLPHDAAASGIPFTEFLARLPADYVKGTASGSNSGWLNPVSDVFLPQRGAQFGLPLVLGIMLMVWAAPPLAPASRRNALALAGIIAGLLPFVSAHAFLSLSIAFGAMATLDFLSLRTFPGGWTHFFLPACILALPQLLFFSSRASTGSFIRFGAFWAGSLGGPLAFWLASLGLFLPLALFGWFVLNPVQRKWHAGFLALFLAANVVLFSPWPLDNMKLFACWLLVAAPAASLALASLLKKLPASLFRPLSFAALAVLLTLSGMLSLAHELESHYLFLSNEDIAFGNWVAQHTPPDSVILTSEWHAHPVESIGGRQAVMGYRGWLWSYGVDYRQQESDVREMFAGGTNASELLSAYGVRFIVASRGNQQADAPVNQSFLGRFPIAYSSESFTVYSV